MKEIIENLKSRKQVIDFAKQENINLIELDFNNIFTDFVPANLKNEIYLLRAKVGRSYILVLLQIDEGKAMIVRKVSFGDGKRWEHGVCWLKVKNEKGNPVRYGKTFFENIEDLISAYETLRMSGAWNYTKHFIF